METDALYPAPSASEAADTPLSVRFINVSQILVAAQASEEAIPQAISQITDLLRERHRLKSGGPGRFPDPRHDRNHQGADLARPR